MNKVLQLIVLCILVLGIKGMIFAQNYSEQKIQLSNVWVDYCRDITYVRGFDQTGARSYNMSPFSDLQYVGPGYGYWIKIADEVQETYLQWNVNE